MRYNKIKKKKPSKYAVINNLHHSYNIAFVISKILSKNIPEHVFLAETQNKNKFIEYVQKKIMDIILCDFTASNSRYWMWDLVKNFYPYNRHIVNYELFSPEDLHAHYLVLCFLLVVILEYKEDKNSLRIVEQILSILQQKKTALQHLYMRMKYDYTRVVEQINKCLFCANSYDFISCMKKFILNDHVLRNIVSKA
jgi:hypothetical protein